MPVGRSSSRADAHLLRGALRTGVDAQCTSAAHRWRGLIYRCWRRCECNSRRCCTRAAHCAQPHP
ncbi:hypothetical protein XMIN_4285 [Xanthomonas citri pv. mangiferaeindicae LMG 941]|nr:hypothetical protein XMIN_4285 [Xanthomonas citri pv. mangiferaeindicae LMG 941]